MIVEQIWTGNAYRNFNYLIVCPETGEAMAAALRETLKPNPDAAVTLIGPAPGSADATVAGAADTDATIVTQPAAGATVAGAPPPGTTTVVPKPS